MNYIEGLTIDEIYPKILKKLLNEGDNVSPRGLRSLELTGFKIVLKDPLSRILYSPTRNINLMFAFAEWLWIVSGSNQLDFIQYYNKKYINYSDDGYTLNGAYGKRIFNTEDNKKSQWDKIIELLKEDPDTRQAVLDIHLPSDLNLKSRDIPCTCTIQFLIRKKKLHCITHMRSNDVIWGVPYDIFNFTMLQEILAKLLNVDLGTYTHIAGSMHIYEQHQALAQKILNEKQDYDKFRMKSIGENIQMNIHKLIKYEKDIRTNSSDKLTINDEYWNDILNIIKFHHAWRINDREKQLLYYNMLPDYYTNLLVSKIEKERD